MDLCAPKSFSVLFRKANQHSRQYLSPQVTWYLSTTVRRYCISISIDNGEIGQLQKSLLFYTRDSQLETVLIVNLKTIRVLIDMSNVSFSSFRERCIYFHVCQKLMQMQLNITC